jgi:catechol 2,3-dioxygenase
VPAIHPETRIGHVHLKVADLDRALAFYRDVLGFEVTQRIGNTAAFLSAGGYHHHIASTPGRAAAAPRLPPAPPASTISRSSPTRAELADALRRLIRAHIPLEGAADHGVSQALYLRDPDGNGVELYWDRPAEEWPRNPQGELAMVTEALDLEELLTQHATESAV